MTVELVKSGIPGLDHILKGGIKKHSSVLVSGVPGSGKTMIGLQFIYFGATQFGENGIYITSEETEKDLRSYAHQLGMNWVAAEQQNKIFLVEKKPTRLSGGIISIKGLLDIITKYQIKRIALDSLNFFQYLYPKNKYDDLDFRREVLLFLGQVKEAGVTFVAVNERNSINLDNVEFTPMDFLFEGLMLLTRIRKGSYYERVISVTKMRGQPHSLDVYPISIDGAGIKVLHDQVPFSLVEQQEK